MRAGMKMRGITYPSLSSFLFFLLSKMLEAGTTALKTPVKMDPVVAEGNSFILWLHSMSHVLNDSLILILEIVIVFILVVLVRNLSNYKKLFLMEQQQQEKFIDFTNYQRETLTQGKGLVKTTEKTIDV